MTNAYFNHDNPESRRTLARAESINATFEAIAAGFELLPDDTALKQGRVTWAIATGGPAVYAVTLPFTPSTYASGLNLRFKVPKTNIGACAINVMGPTGPLGAKALKRFNGADTLPDDMVAGAVADVAYDGSQFILVGVHGASEQNCIAAAEAAAASVIDAGWAAPAGRMIWDIQNGAVDPGPGTVRADSGVVTEITAIYISQSDVSGADLAQTFAAWNASTNQVKGRLRIGTRTNLQKWVEADVLGLADHGAWWTITVSSPTGPGGFGAADVVAVGFSRSGDKGAVASIWGGTAGGTASALTATAGGDLLNLTTGQIVGLKMGASANPGAATLNVDGLGAKDIQKNGAALAGGELPASANLFFQYDGAAFQLISSGASGAFSGASSKSGNYDLKQSDGGGVIKCTASVTLTMRPASGLPAAWWVTISNRSTGVVTIAPAGTDTIAGVNSPWILRSGQDVTIYRSGSSGYEAVGLSLPVTDSQVAWSAVDKASGITLSNNNMTATGTSGAGSVRGTVGVSGGKRYLEYRIVTANTDNTVGLARSTMSLSSGVGVVDANGWGYVSDGRKVSNGTYTSYGSSVSDNGVVMVAVDVDAGKLWFGVNGVWQGSGDPVAGTNPSFTGVTGTLFPAFGDKGDFAPAATLIVSLSSFVYSPPTGYTTFF